MTRVPVLNLDSARLRRIRDQRSSSIYFVQSGNTGPIKIGSAWDLYERLSSLQTGNPAEIYYLTSVDVPRAEVLHWERAVHREFSQMRIRGEWFRPERRLLDAVEGVHFGDDIYDLCKGVMRP